MYKYPICPYFTLIYRQIRLILTKFYEDVIININLPGAEQVYLLVLVLD